VHKFLSTLPYLGITWILIFISVNFADGATDRLEICLNSIYVKLRS